MFVTKTQLLKIHTVLELYSESLRIYPSNMTSGDIVGKTEERHNAEPVLPTTFGGASSVREANPGPAWRYRGVSGGLHTTYISRSTPSYLDPYYNFPTMHLSHT